MELFSLFGKIAVNNDEANRRIEETTQKASGMATKVGSSLIKTGESVTSLGKKFAPLSTAVTAVGGASVKTFADFEDGMLKVQSLSGATGTEFEQLKQTAEDFGASTAWSASDVADAMGYMALAGFDAGQIMESTGGMLSLASASGEDLATVTDILTDSMTAFGDEADQAGRYADVLATTQAKSNTTVGLLGEAFKYVAPLAGSYGYQLEDVSTALGQMANAGVKGSMAGTALSSIITRLGNNTDGCRDSIEELGVKFYNNDGTARNLSDVMKDLCDATSGMTVEQKSAIAKQIAGQEAMKGLLAILNQGSGSYEKLEGKIKNCDGAATEMANNMESGLGGSIRSLKSALEGVAITLGEKLSPYIQGAANQIKNLCTWFQNLSPGMQETIVKIGLFIAALAPVLLASGKVITGVGNMINAFVKVKNTLVAVREGFILAKSGFTALGTVASPLGSMLGQLWTVLMANPIILVVAGIAALVAGFVLLWNKSESFRNFWIGLWEGIKSAVSTAVNSVVAFFSNLWTQITGIFNNIVTTVQSAWNTICNVVQVAIMLIGSILSAAFQIITIPFMFIWENCKEMIMSAWNGIKSIVSSGMNAVRSAISSGMNAVKSIFSTIWNAIKSVVTSAVNGIKSVVSSAFNAIRSVISSIMNAIRSVISTVWNGIKSVISTILNGIKSVVTSIWNGIKSVITNAVNRIKSAVSSAFNAMKSAIKTPLNAAKSTVLGIFESIKTGISNKLSAARDAVGRLIESIRSKFNFSWSLPHLKLPHPKISGKFSVNPPSVPSFSLDWYAKAMDDGMIMNQPTIFGVNGNGKLMAGGEKGSETVVGTASLMGMITEAVSKQNGETKNILLKILEVLTALHGGLYETMVRALQTMGIEFDERELGRLVKKYA